MSIEMHAKKALWMTASMKVAREVVCGVEACFRAAANTASGIQEAIWLIEADAGRRYEAATGVDLSAMQSHEDTDYHGYSEVIGYDGDDEDEEEA